MNSDIGDCEIEVNNELDIKRDLVQTTKRIASWVYFIFDFCSFYEYGIKACKIMQDERQLSLVELLKGLNSWRLQFLILFL